MDRLPRLGHMVAVTCGRAEPLLLLVVPPEAHPASAEAAFGQGGRRGRLGTAGGDPGVSRHSTARFESLDEPARSLYPEAVPVSGRQG